MGIFSIFQRKKQPDNFLLKLSQRNSYLHHAAEAKHKAHAAAKKGKYNRAWKYFHEQKSMYSKHAAISDFTDKQALSLDSSVHENLADILRLQGKHEEALSHILYWVTAGRDRPLKRHDLKFKAYFNRCNYLNTSLSEARRYSKSKLQHPDFANAQSKTKKWKASG